MNLMSWDKFQLKLGKLRRGYIDLGKRTNSDIVINLHKGNLKIITDEPDSNGSLGFAKYSESLTNIIRESSPIFSVGIFGKWGTGKTSLMKMMMERLEDDETVLPVWFDAWRYEKEKYLAVIPFLRQINIELENSFNNKKRSEKWRTIKNGLGNTFNAFMESIQITISIPGSPVSSQVKLEDFMNSLKSKGTTWINNERVQFHEHVTDYLAYALKELRSIDSDYRIVVFIDDLDRCTPENALGVLESIKTFFEIEGIIFVVAMNYDSINNIIRAKYGEDSAIDGFEYMQKIVQLPFEIPNLTKEDIPEFLKYIVTKNLEGSEFKAPFLNDYNNLLINAIDAITTTHGLSWTPREVKRFINNIVLAKNLFVIDHIDELLVVETLAFIRKWKDFLNFITVDDTRHAFLKKYRSLKKELNAIGKIKEVISKEFPNFLKVYPGFFEENDSLRIYLDSGADEILDNIDVLRKYRRAVESVELKNKYQTPPEKIYTSTTGGTQVIYLDPYTIKAELLYESDSVRAEKLLKRSLLTNKVNGFNARALKDLGDIYKQRYLYDIALKYYNKALDLVPNYSLAFFNRGVCKYEVLDYSSALDDFSHIYDIYLNAPLHNNVGSCYWNMGLNENAEEKYRQAIESNAQLIEAYYNLGLLYTMNNKRERARKIFNTCLAIDRNFSPARVAINEIDKWADKSIELEPMIIFNPKIPEKLLVTLDSDKEKLEIVDVPSEQQIRVIDEWISIHGGHF